MLVVDIGNTYTRIGTFTGTELGECVSLPTHATTAQAFARAFRSLGSQGSRVWVSSVAPPAEKYITEAAGMEGLTCRFIRSATDAIMPNRLTTPHTTGVDRLLSAMAAGRRHLPGTTSREYCVIQCGSAATIDLVDADGVFVGGFILPGPSMWLSGLTAAAQLPNLSTQAVDWSSAAPGDNTRDAILHGVAAALPRAVAETARRTGAADKPIIVTGGWGKVVAELLGSGAVHDPNLLLFGIRLFAMESGNE